MGALLLVILTGSGVGRAQTGQLGVGFYVPETRLDHYRRFAFISGVADHLSRSLGVPVVGHAFKHAADLKRELAARRLHFALLGGFYLANNRSGQIIASGELGPDQTLAWSLMSHRKENLMALRGKVLQLPDIGGPALDLVQDGLLQGNLVLKRHFQIYHSPELLSAVEALRLRQAEVVFAPVDAAGLVPLLGRHLNLPPPGFVVLDGKLPAAVVKRAAAAILSLRASAGIQVSWRVADPAQYRRFRASARRQRLGMVMLPPAPVKPQARVFDRQVVRYEIPAIDLDLQVH